jgi:hypothetical protein
MQVVQDTELVLAAAVVVHLKLALTEILHLVYQESEVPALIGIHWARSTAAVVAEPELQVEPVVAEPERYHQLG